MATKICSSVRPSSQDHLVSQPMSKSAVPKRDQKRPPMREPLAQSENLDGDDLLNHRAFRKAVQNLAQQEIDTLAFKTLQLAKRGHKEAFAFVLESLTATEQDRNSSHLSKIGSITHLDEIADAQRHVIMAAAHGEITSTDAIHYMKMLNELGCALKNADLQREIDDIRSYLNEK